MNDKEILYLISIGYRDLDSLATKLNLSLFDTQLIFSDLENRNFIEKKSTYIPRIGDTEDIFLEYILTDNAAEFLDN